MGKTKDVSHQELMEVINSFDFGGKLEEVGIFGNGHINETYCAVFSTEAGQKRYILQKMNRRIIIQILIAPSICEIGGIITAGHTKHTAEQIRSSEEYNGCVGCAQAAAQCQRQLSRTVDLMYHRKDFIYDITIIAFLHPGTIAFITPCVGPALLIHRINGKELNFSTINIILKHIDHPEILKIVTHTVLTREYNNRHPRIAINQYMHLSLKMLAVLCIIMSFHFIQPPLSSYAETFPAHSVPFMSNHSFSSAG